MIRIWPIVMFYRRERQDVQDRASLLPFHIKGDMPLLEWESGTPVRIQGSRVVLKVQCQGGGRRAAQRGLPLVRDDGRQIRCNQALSQRTPQRSQLSRGGDLAAQQRPISKQSFHD